MGDRWRSEPRGAGTALAEAGEDEAALIARARIDPRAFAPLYRRYAGQIYGYCHHRLGSREAAEDATSQVFAKALGSLSSCRGDAVRAWLFGIAHHVVADSFRARDPEAPLEAASKIFDTSPSPEDLAEAGDARRRLWAALAQLPPEQRRVVELRLAGLTSTEIGQALGRSRGAVDVAQCRAVARLRGLLVTAEEGRHGPR